MPKDPCSELASTIHQMAMLVGEDPGVGNLDDIVSTIQKDVPEFTREVIVDSIIEATSYTRAQMTDIQQKLADIRAEARLDASTRRQIERLQSHLKEGTDTESKETRNRSVSETMEALRQTRDELQKEISNSPVRRIKRAESGLRKSIIALEKRLEDGTLPEGRNAEQVQTDVIQQLRAVKDLMRDELSRSEAAVVNRLVRRAESLTLKLENFGKEPEKFVRPASDRPKSDRVMELGAANEQMAQQLADRRTETDLRKRGADKQRMLDEGRIPDQRQAKARTETIEELRRWNKDLSDQIRKSDPARLRRVQSDIDRMIERIESNNFRLPEAKPQEFGSRELLEAELKARLLRQEIDERIRELKPSGAEDAVKSVLDLQRAVQFGTDIGQVLRQGKQFVLGNLYRNPKVIADTYAKMWQAFLDPVKAYEIEKYIENHPDTPYAHKAGLSITQEGGKARHQEEIFQFRQSKIGKIVVKALGVDRFERAFRTFLNLARLHIYASGSRYLARGSQPTLSEAKIIAQMANVATGRGSIHENLQGSMVLLNNVFLATRYQTSRFQNLILYPLWGGLPSQAWNRVRHGSEINWDAHARLWVAREYAFQLAGLATWYGALMTAGSFLSDDDDQPYIVYDTSSSDFGKVVFPATGYRIDPLAGMSQWAVQAHKRATGKKSLISGKEVELKGMTSKSDFGDFFRGRLAPVPGAFWDKFIANQTMDRKEPTMLNISKDLLFPITPEESLKIWEQENLPRSVFFEMLMFHGEGVARYGDRK